ncbi:MAG: hypothetical protein AAF333_05105 [Planctomycetota bacterium]
MPQPSAAATIDLCYAEPVAGDAAGSDSPWWAVPMAVLPLRWLAGPAWGIGAWVLLALAGGLVFWPCVIASNRIPVWASDLVSRYYEQPSMQAVVLALLGLSVVLGLTGLARAGRGGAMGRAGLHVRPGS